MPTGNVPITAGSGTLIRSTSNPAVDGGAIQQLFSLAAGDASLGALARYDPDGTLQASAPASGLFIDDFSGTLATNHTVGGTAPTSTNGIVTANAGTTASATSYMRSVPAFLLRAGSYLRNAWNIKVDTAAVANSTRWWGYGLNQTTPTSAAPVLNGVVFEIATADGLLYAVAYANGTRTQVAALTRPTDGNYHRYEIWFRQSALYWLIDGNLVASISISSASFPQLTQVQNLASIFGIANSATAPASAPVLQATSVTVTDHSGYHHGIGDGINPYLQATVKAASTAITATDFPLAVGLHPTSPLPAGTNAIGNITSIVNAVGLAAGTNQVGSILNINGASSNTYTLITAATTNAAVIKTAAGNLFELTVSNPTATACFVKLYQKASAPTVGTDVPVATYRVAATGAAGDTITIAYGANGKRFQTGIAIAVTGAAAASDTTAAVALVQIHGSYL